ncbi:MAG: type II toxin-antitoxin system VapC family toxin [Nitrososphaerales archaeon]
MIILDKDVLKEIFDKRSARGDEALKRIVESGEEINITAINFLEVLYGLRKYAKPVRDVMKLPVLNFTKRDAALSAQIELEAERKGIPIRRTDATIAAITLNNGASLYTIDLKHFQQLKVFGLKLFP